MVAQAPSLRRRAVRAGLLGLCICWASFAALPALASATAYTKPTSPVTEPPFSESLTGAYKACWQQITEKPVAIPAEGSSTQWWTYSTARTVAQACESGLQASAAVAERLWWITAEHLHDQEKLEALSASVAEVKAAVEEVDASLSSSGALFGESKLIADALGKEGQLHADLTSAGVVVASLPSLPSGEAPLGTVAVSNPPDIEALQATVSTGTETANQNVWAIFGMVVGFGFLALIYKLVRP